MPAAERRAPWPPGLFACPACRLALDEGDKLACRGCGRSYLSADGTPCFNDRGAYQGPIPPRDEMHRILALARTEGYRRVLEGDLATRDPELVRYLTDVGRTGGLALLELTGAERVLDFGCSFGVFARELARRARLVVALDATHEKLQFLGIVREQDHLDGLVPVCNGRPAELPFADGYFDWVVLNAVFEYLPQAIEAPDVRAAHARALREFARILRPGGRLYLATKNRFSYNSIRGCRTALLPRAIAHRLAGGTIRDPYRQVLHGLWGYRRLLREAGFHACEFRWALPGLWYPTHFVRLSAARARMLDDLRAAPGGRRPKRAAWRLLAALGVLPFLAPNYLVLARKGAA